MAHLGRKFCSKQKTEIVFHRLRSNTVINTQALCKNALNNWNILRQVWMIYVLYKWSILWKTNNSTSSSKLFSKPNDKYEYEYRQSTYIEMIYPSRQKLFSDLLSIYTILSLKMRSKAMKPITLLHTEFVRNELNCSTIWYWLAIEVIGIFQLRFLFLNSLVIELQDIDQTQINFMFQTLCIRWAQSSCAYIFSCKTFGSACTFGHFYLLRLWCYFWQSVNDALRITAPKITISPLSNGKAQVNNQFFLARYESKVDNPTVRTRRYRLLPSISSRRYINNNLYDISEHLSFLAFTLWIIRKNILHRTERE